MRGFFEIVTKKKRLLYFTERLSELLSSGLSLQKSLYLLGKMKFRDIRMNQLASFLQKALFNGTKFSVALKMAPFISVAEWYSAFITVAEESGEIALILEHLTWSLVREKLISQKLFEALLYPCFVILMTALAGFFSVFYFLPSFNPLFGENAGEIQDKAVRTMIFGDFFLAFSFALLIFLARKILSPSPCTNVIKTMAFLSESSVSTMASLSCALAIAARKRKIASALLEVKNCLLDGEKIADCFGKCFEKAGFIHEGIVLAENLMLSQETGRGDGFSRTYAYFTERQEKGERLFFSLLQPLLLTVAAVYLLLIMKSAFLPYITSFGGFL